MYNPPVFHYSASRGPVLPVLSLPILAAILNRAGYRTWVVDMEAKRMHPKRVELDADVIGMTSLTTNRRAIPEMIGYLRKRGFKGTVMVGGVYATLYPDEVLGWGADLVVTGECEGNIVELLKSGARGIQAGKRLPIEQIPIPDWVHHDPGTRVYRGNMRILSNNPGITMWTRGCPYKCIFCENIIFQGQPTRYRPPNNIGQEMTLLRDMGHEDIFIYDDELVGTRMPDGWMAEIADHTGPLKLNMLTQGRCSEKFITPEIMREAKRAGINTVFWGVESLSPRVLNAINKRMTVKDVWHTLETAKNAGIRNGLYIQVGQYQEDANECKKTESALKSLCDHGLIDYLNVFVTSVNPGTRLYDIAREEGWYEQPPEGWRGVKSARYDTPWMSRDKIREWRGRYREACPTPAL